MEYHRTRDILHVMQLLGHRASRTPSCILNWLNSRMKTTLPKLPTQKKKPANSSNLALSSSVISEATKFSGNASKPHPRQNGRGLSVAGGVGFEPTTPNLGGWCSIRPELRERVLLGSLYSPYFPVQQVTKNIGRYNHNV